MRNPGRGAGEGISGSFGNCGNGTASFAVVAPAIGGGASEWGAC